ncbi:MAG: LysR family transcriptional regulator [Methyloversatilis sp.]|nr:LysR family transcriptional regulator [Methyloversatilis sp.]MBP6193278.1 LysR family transcriptional regulator [Methyloversatilis sp.]MBP9117237.1 LysR family transcriptional regulator [Methyloversatilis sp.]
MPDRRLEVFHAAASQMSFTRAAELLQMTQPAVTFQIKQLEEHFGTRLFERAHGRVTLTPEGLRVKDYADRILDLFANLENELQEMSVDLRGHLLIGATPTVAEYHLPPVLAEFRVAHPNVVPRLTVDNPDVIEDMVDQRILDIGIVEGLGRGVQVMVEPCAEDELVVVCSPDFPLAKLGEVTPEHLLQYPCAGRDAGSVRALLDNYLSRGGVDPAKLPLAFELDRLSSVKGVLERGLAYSILSRAVIRHEASLGLLVAVPLRPRLVRHMALLYPSERFRTYMAKQFGEFAAVRLSRNAGA